MNGAIQGKNQHNEELYQTAMSVYEVENSQNENKAHRELNNTNIDNRSLNTDLNAQEASMEVIEQDKVAAIVPKPKDGIYELCSARKDKLLPFLNNNSLLFEKLARSFAWEINTNDKLRACSQLSIVNAFYKCCEYGLDPASSLGQAWLISYKSNIDLQIGYRGWLKLLLNNPLVSNVYSYGVYKDDFFEYELGMNPNIKHIPSKEKQHKDNLIATYGVVKLKSSEAQIKVCFRDEINESMECSSGSYKSDSPWVKHFEAMALVVPIRNFDSAYESLDTIVLIASGLQGVAIPALSYAIVHGGLDGFIHLANNIQGASNNAASIAAGEVTSGNRSFDNISQNTASIGNKSGFKTDFNQLYQEGATQVQTADGSILRTFANGQSGMSSGAGVNLSSGSTSLMLESGKASNLTEAYTQGLSAIKGLEQHFQQAETSTIKDTTDRVAHLAQRQAAGKSTNIDTSTEEGRNMQHAINNTIALHDKKGHGWTQAAKATVTAYADGSINTPSAMPLFKASAGVRTDGSASTENNSNQSLDKENSTRTENSAGYNINSLVKAASNKSYTTDDSIDQTLANSTAASYEKMQNYGEALSQRKEEVENYNLALQATQHKAATDRRDMTHEVEDQVMKRYGVSREDAHKMVQSLDPRAQKVWQGIVESETAKEIAQVKASKQHVEDMAGKDAVLFKNEHSGKVNNQGQIDLQKEAAKDGLDANLMNAKIQGTKGDINGKQTEMTENANNQIHSIEHHNKVMEQEMNDKIKEYEKAKISQSRNKAPQIPNKSIKN